MIVRLTIVPDAVNPLHEIQEVMSPAGMKTISFKYDVRRDEQVPSCNFALTFTGHKLVNDDKCQNSTSQVFFEQDGEQSSSQDNKCANSGILCICPFKLVDDFQ